MNEKSIYVIDSFPIAACDNNRIIRSKRYRGEVWRGRQASKRRFFSGFKLHLMVTGSIASTDYTLEDLFHEVQSSLSPLPKSNPKRIVKPWVHYLQASYWLVIDTTGSLIKRLLPKSIQAFTALLKGKTTHQPIG